jgi:D-amino peptidase
MKVYINADIEGVSYLVDGSETAKKNGEDFETFRRLLTAEVKAACEGAFEGGADEVVVNDFHANGRNIFFDELPEKVQLVRGDWRPTSGVDGAEDVDAFMMVGVHSMTGSFFGPVSHTICGQLFVTINGRPAGEYQLISAVWGERGVPAVLACGDDVAMKQAKDFHPTVECVVTKYGLKPTAARCIHPKVVRHALREAAKKSVMSLKKHRPFVFRKPVRMTIRLPHPEFAADCEWIPGVKRTDAWTIAFTAGSMLEAYKLIFGVGNMCRQ